MKLHNQVVIVTGAGRGIGRAIAQQCAAARARVVLTARTEAQIQQAAAEIPGETLAVPADVTDVDSVKNLIETAEATFGPVDLLINNAGSAQALGPIWEIDPQDWWRELSVNVQGVFLPCHAVLPGMIARHSGRIINLLGAGTRRPFPYGSAYGTSKAAVMRLTEQIALEVEAHNVKVFGMNPGLVRTGLTEHIMGSEQGQRWLPFMGQQFDEAQDVPPTLAGDLAVEIGSGRYDAFHGRALAVFFDLAAMEARVNEIIEKDLYTLRLTQLDGG